MARPAPPPPGRRGALSALLLGALARVGPASPVWYGRDPYDSRTISACDPDVSVVGRHTRLRPPDGGAEGCWGVAFDFQGVEVSVRLQGAAWAFAIMEQEDPGEGRFRSNLFNVHVDGVLRSTFSTATWAGRKDVVVPLVDGVDANATHDISIVKLSEPQYNAGHVKSNYVTLLGFVGPTSMKFAAPQRRPARKIEFVGDSITAGYCNAAPALNNESAQCAVCTDDPKYEWFNMSWPPRLCQDFQAECHYAAWSGLGVVQNCCQQGETFMPSVWKRTLGSFSSLDSNGEIIPNHTPSYNLWDFTTWVPDLVIMNLGTNDVFGGWTKEVADRYHESYMDVVQFAVQAYGSRTKFLLACGPMTAKNCVAVSKVVEGVRSAAPAVDIMFLNMTKYLNDDYGPSRCGHPSTQVDKAMAQGMLPVVAELMAWHDVHAADLLQSEDA